MGTYNNMPAHVQDRIEAMAVRSYYRGYSMAASLREDAGDAAADYYLAVQWAIEIDYEILDAKERARSSQA